MPKATLHFDLPEEQSEFKDAVKGTEYICALHDFSEWLRRHDDGDPRPTYHEVWDAFREILADRDIDLYKD